MARAKRRRTASKRARVSVGGKHCLKFGAVRYCCHRKSVSAFGRRAKVNRVFCRKVTKSD